MTNNSCDNSNYLIWWYIVVDANSVYSWGDNTNFTLGHSTEQRRIYPERVEMFKNDINVKDVSIDKYVKVYGVCILVSTYMKKKAWQMAIYNQHLDPCTFVESTTFKNPFFIINLVKALLTRILDAKILDLT